MTPPWDAHVIGAGPAGLTAARELTLLGLRPLVLEAGDTVGGIARTEVRGGYRIDVGGHRFYTKVEEVDRLWRQIMGADFLEVDRMSRILFNGSFFRYPLSLPNVLDQLGVVESLRVLASFLKARVVPHRTEENLEQWVVNRFGDRLYRTFFKTYTEKVWGVPCTAIRAEWAAQRIKDLSFWSAVWNAIRSNGKVTSLIERFHYPRLGPGQLWERVAAEVAAGGGEVRTGSPVRTIHLESNRVVAVSAGEDRRAERLPAERLISSMALRDLIAAIDPPPPVAVRRAAASLQYRDFLIVTLIVRRREVFPDNWIYIHSPEVRVGRVQNFKNWSAELVPDPDTTSLGMEYFCSVGDDLWRSDDDELVELARREAAALGLVRPEDVVDATVVRQLKAYPVYDADYRGHLEVVKGWLDTVPNLQTIGRNGLHRYNNQDHSMLCGLFAARNLTGAEHDLWQVNTDRSYYEEFTRDEARSRRKAAAR